MKDKQKLLDVDLSNVSSSPISLLDEPDSSPIIDLTSSASICKLLNKSFSDPMSDSYHAYDPTPQDLIIAKASAEVHGASKRKSSSGSSVGPPVSKQKFLQYKSDKSNLCCCKLYN